MQKQDGIPFLAFLCGFGIVGLKKNGVFTEVEMNVVKRGRKGG